MNTVKKETVCIVKPVYHDLSDIHFHPLAGVSVSIPDEGTMEFDSTYFTSDIVKIIKDRFHIKGTVSLLWEHEKDIPLSDLQTNFSDVLCYYTGGGIYVYSARYKDVYLYGSLDEYIYCVPYRAELFYEEFDTIEEYIPHEMKRLTASEIKHFEDSVLPSDGILPTWKEILYSIKLLNKHRNIDTTEAIEILRYCNPDLSKYIND